MSSNILYDLGSVGSLQVATGTGGAVVLDADYITPTRLVGIQGAPNYLFEDLYWVPGGAWVRAGAAFGNLYGNLSFQGF
jgi:hypothetical protein